MKTLNTNCPKFKLLILALLVSFTVSVLVFVTIRYWLSQKLAAEKVEFYVNGLEIMQMRQSQNLPSGSMLFFGDSHIQGMAVTSVSPNAVNFGIGHLTLQRLSQRLLNYPYLDAAGGIIIGAGINDLLTKQQIGFEEGLARILSVLDCCESKSFVISMLPVNESIVKRPKFNDEVVIFNTKLKEAIEKTHIKYIDVYPFFVDSKGQLLKLYDLGDGLHLNRLGYEQIIKIIKVEISKEIINEK